MRSRREGLWLASLLALVAVLGYLGRPTPEPAATPAPVTTPTAEALPSPRSVVGVEAPSPTLRPLPGVQAPALTEKVTVLFETEAGNLTMEVYPQAAPHAAGRFLALVNAGFYDVTPIFRVVPGFVCQYGLNSRFADRKDLTSEIADDLSLFQMERGTLAFAKSGMPNSASTQVFINYSDTTEALVPEKGGKGVGIFTAFGKVISGMDGADRFRAVGDPNMGLDQGELGKDTPGYLQTLPEKPTMILRARVVP